MLLDADTKNLYLKNNKILDFKSMKWIEIEELPKQLIEISKQDAIRELQSGNNKIKIPVGVIGTNAPSSEQYNLARALGQSLADVGLSIICGGRAGVMEAVCKGSYEYGGLSIGILPENNLDNVNSYVSLPLATGVGFARNAIIASSSLCLIAVGGGNGTLSEIAYGLQFNKKVFVINSTLTVDGVVYCSSIEEIMDNIFNVIFNYDELN